MKLQKLVTSLALHTRSVANFETLTSSVSASMESFADFYDLSSPNESEHNSAGASPSPPIQSVPNTAPGSQAESDFDPSESRLVSAKRGTNYTTEDFTRLFDATEAAFEAMVSAGVGGPHTTGPTAEAFEKLAQEKEDLYQTNVDLRDELREAEEEIESKREQIFELLRQLNDARSSGLSAKSPGTGADASIALPCQQCSEYARQIENIKLVNFGNLQRETMQLRNQLAEKDRVYAVAERDLQIYRQRLKELGTERDALKQRVDELQKLAEKRKRSLEKAEEQKQQYEENARTELAAAMNENKKLRVSLQQNIDAIGTMNNVAKTHEHRADRLKEEAETLRAKVAALEQALAEQKKNVEKDAAESALAKQALENLQNDILEREHEIVRWKNAAEKVQAAQHAIDEKDREIQYLRNTITGQRPYFEQKLKIASDQISESRALLEKYASTRTLNEQLRHENRRLRHELKQANERAFGVAAGAAAARSPAATFDQSELVRLRKENRSLADELEKLRRQADSDKRTYERRCEDLSRKRNELSENVVQLETEKFKLNNDIQRLKMELDQATFDCLRLRGDNAKLQNALGGVEILKKEKADLQTKYGDLKKVYDECSQQLAQRQADLTRATGDLESTIMQKQLLVSENSVLSGRISELSDQVAGLIEDQENLPAKIKAEVTPFQEANATLLKQLAKAEEDLKQEQHVSAELRDSLTAAKAELERVQAELQNQRANSISDVTQLMKDLTDVRGERTRLKAGHDALVEERKRIEAERLRLELDLNSVRSELSDLQRSLPELQQTKQILASSLGKAELRYRSLRKEFEEAKVEHLQEQQLHSETVKSMESRLNKFENTIRILTSST